MLANTEYSVDGGLSWLKLDDSVRVIFREASEDDDSLQDLHITITNEGLIYDLVDQPSGEVVKTGCKLAVDIPEELV